MYPSLPDDMLLEVYYKAIELQLDQEFIELIKRVMMERGLIESGKLS
ncbi:sporulation histidine kinase inhibitor Sda [Bacillaceae bacterium S4-13-58]